MAIDPAKYEAALRLEAAGKLPAQHQAALNRLRTAGAVPALEPWGPDHPQIAVAEEKYKLPKGALSALATVESGGDPQAVSPTGVTGLFQVTKRTGKPYGLTELNRTNPYLSTDVAARHLAALMQSSGGDIEKALLKYKGPDQHDPANGQTTHAEYLQRWRTAFAKYGGTPETAVAQAPAPAPTTAAAPPAPAPTPPTFMEAFRSRAGFGEPRTDLPGPNLGPLTAAGDAVARQFAGSGELLQNMLGIPQGAPEVLGLTAENLATGPAGALLKMLGVPGAAVQAAGDVTGHPTLGFAGRLATDALMPKVATAVGSRAAARVLPRTVARTLVPRAAARLDVRDARRAIPALEGQITTLGQTATTAAQQAAQAKASSVALGEAARTAGEAAPQLPRTLGELGRAAQQSADDVVRAGIASQQDAGKALSAWRVAKAKLFGTVEQLAGDAPVIDTGALREAMTAHGYATVTDDGLDLLTTGLGLGPEGRAILRKSFDGPLTFAEARRLQTEIGSAAFRGTAPIGSPQQGLAKSFYTALGRGIDDFLTTDTAGVAPALAEAKQAYRTGKLLFNDSAKRLVTGSTKTPAAVERVVAKAFAPGKITDTLDYKQLVSDETYTTAVQGWLARQFQKAGGPKATAQTIAKTFQPYLDSGHLEVILQPEQARLLRWQIAQGLEQAGKPARAAAILGERAQQATGQAKTLGAQSVAAQRTAKGLETQVRQLTRQSDRAQRVLQRPTMTRRLIRATGKKAAIAAGLGAAGAGAYFGARSLSGNRTP